MKMVDDRIYIDRGIDAGTAALLSRNNNDPMTMLAAMNGGMGNNWNNNPFIYLILLFMFGRNGLWGNGCENSCNNPQMAALSAQLSENQNSSLLMDGIKGNANAINQLAQNVNCDFGALNNAVCNVQNAITQVGGQIGFSAERVINAVNMGDCGVITAIKDCCCGTQKQILESGYQNQIATLNQTNAITSDLSRGFNGLNNAINQGFAQVGFTNSQLTCELLNASNANTQRIIDTLNNHWNSDLQQRYNDARLELSQKAQNEYLISQLTSARRAA